MQLTRGLKLCGKMGNSKMSPCVIFVLCFSALVGLCSSCFPRPPAPPTPPEPEIEEYDPYPTINGGIPVGPSDPIPYQLSIRYEKNGTWNHICGGVILDEKTAITAAHCFDNSRNVSRYLVVAEEHILSVAERYEQILHLKKLIIHPNYINYTRGSDIALLKVDEFRLGQNQHAQPVLLRRVSNEILSGLNAVISGWGVVSDKEVLSNVLQRGYVSILSAKDCLDRLKNRMKVPVRKGIVCAHDPVQRTCSGDSGGPLVIPNYKVEDSTERGNLLVGITSFGPKKCSRPNSAGAFADINYFYDWIQLNRDSSFISSCSDAMETLSSPRSKKQRIYPHGNSWNLEVVCDFENDGGGWTIIQKRTSGPKHEFNRNWDEYAKGFGSVSGNFWLGLDNIHQLTKNGDQELRIDLEDFEREKRWTKYSNFSISDASDFYRFTIGGFYGNSTAGDSMTNIKTNYGTKNNQNGMRFTTNDKDNDNYSGNCAVSSGGSGWWSFMIRWSNVLSGPFPVIKGVRPGGILSPYFFALYLDDLSQ